MQLLLTAISSYLLGSIPFGYLLVRIFRGTDVRQTGSGNIGATNVSRTSPALGIATLVLDALKGFVAAAIAHHFHSDPVHLEQAAVFVALAGFFAVLGHSFPAWLRFRGGKGVATGLGAFLWLTPKALLVMVGIFMLLAAAFRYVSLASVVASLCLPFLAWWLDQLESPAALLLLGSTAGLVILRHYHNIRRLFAGRESRLGASQA